MLSLLLVNILISNMSPSSLPVLASPRPVINGQCVCGECNIFRAKNFTRRPATDVAVPPFDHTPGPFSNHFRTQAVKRRGPRSTLPPLWRTAFTVSISITHTGFAGQGLELELGLGSASWSRRRRRRTRKIWQRASVNLHVNENVTPATPASEPLPLPRVRYWEKRGVDLIINI